MSSRRLHAGFTVILLLAASYHHERGFIASVKTTAETNEIAPTIPVTMMMRASTTTELRYGNATASDPSSVPNGTTTTKTEPTKKTKSLTIATNRSRHEDFLPENIGWPSNVPCGSFKCFYRLKSNQQVGYLIAPEMKSKRIRSLEAGWQLANQLKSNYNISHFLLEPPRELQVSRKLGERLKKRFQKGSTISLQKVKVAPRQNLLIGCVENKYAAFKKTWPKFLAHVKDPEAFTKNFSKNLGEARRIVENEPYKCLIKDFQLMVDTSGKIYHLDFDRCYRSSGDAFRMSKSFITSCFHNLEKIERCILDGVAAMKQ